MTLLRRGDWYDPEPAPEPEAPPHAIRCEKHGWYRGLGCPRCREEQLESEMSEGAKRIKSQMERWAVMSSIEKGKTHCPAGHEYTAGNTSLNRYGWRSCRACRRERYRKRTAKPEVSI